MSPQEIFDQVATHLLTQNQRSIDLTTHRCRYRFNGLKCAVGCLITDEEYCAEMENRPANSVITKFGLHRLSDHVDLLSELQSLHDTGKIENWIFRLQRIAIDHKLSINSLLKFAKTRRFEDIRVGEYFRHTTPDQEDPQIVWQKIRIHSTDHTVEYPINCICISGKFGPYPVAASFNKNDVLEEDDDAFIICDKDGFIL